jgi:hypothetical protein
MRSRRHQARPWARAAGLGLGACVTLLGEPARAGSFFEDGSFAFDAQAAWTMDFEEAVLPSDAGDAPAARLESDSALSGRWVLALGANQESVAHVVLPMVARTYRASMWIRGSEATGHLGVGYTPGDDRFDEVATLYPTGRVTSDGWVELANRGLRIDGTRAVVVELNGFAPYGAEIDALELVPDGPFDGAPSPSCAGAVDSTSCGVGQICMWSQCRNVNGWVPPIPQDREAVTLYLEHRLRALFGPFLERTLDLPNAMTAIEQMRHATDPWSYWNGYMLAVRRLHDGHTSTSGTYSHELVNPKPLAVCFLEGDADLSHGTEASHPLYHDLLVSHVGSDHDLGLRAGDRLVRVDGMHPMEWARSLTRIHWSQPAISNHRTFGELAASMRSLVSRYADRIEVIRCEPDAPSCGPVETISIRDLPFDPPGTEASTIACDNRPLRHLAASPPSHQAGYYDVLYGIVNESDAVERVYGVEWESLMTTDGLDGMGANMKAAIDALRADARGAIFDHRTGYGGTFEGPVRLWDFAATEHAISVFQSRQRAEDEQPTEAQGLALFQQAVAQGWAQVAGGSDPTDMPVALLVTTDVSASDWLPLGLKGAPSVRIFGPYETNGGFSTRLLLGYWFGLQIVLASGDSFGPDGRTLNGSGVVPDELVLPRQSDLLAGTDTVFARALEWVRGELPP